MNSSPVAPAKSVLLIGGDDIALRASLAKQLIRHGWAVSMLGSQTREAIPEFIDAYYEYDLRRELRPLADLKAIFQIRRVLRENSFDLIHVFDTKPGIFVPLAATGTGHRVIRTITGLGRIFVENTISNRLLRIVYSICHRTLGPRVSKTIFYNASDFKHFTDNALITAAKGTVIPGSGIDAERFNPDNFSVERREQLRHELKLEPERVTCACIAKLEHRKGVPEYIEAAKICASRALPVDFILVGPLVRETPDLNYATLASSDGIRYLGERNDVQNILAVTDIMILPTRYPEGIPRVLTEAASMGLALISTDQPGCRAVIDDNQNGFLVSPGTAEQLADNVQKFVDDRALLANAKNSSLKKAPKFMLGEIAGNVVATYDELLGNARNTVGEK